LTAFFLFARENREKIRQDFPDAPVTEITRILSEKWRNLDEGIRAIYQEKHDNLKREYEISVREYERTHGPIVKERLSGSIFSK